MLTEIKQPVAWELQGKLRELADMRPNMQSTEWENRFAEFWPYSFKELMQPEARQHMFDTLSNNGLSNRLYASELDKLIANNDGWRARISDLFLVCSAFPICNVNVCHHRSIEHRRGYQDLNGRIVPPHKVRSFFGHRGRLSTKLNDVHKAAINQSLHDQAIDIMLSHLLNHRSGFVIIDICQKCKKEFEALRLIDPADYKAKYREKDAQGYMKYEYDIGMIGADGNLIAVFEALNTHRMGADKREHAEKQGYQWVEYSALVMSSNNQNCISSLPGGWLAINAIKLKSSHSGATKCQICSKEIEKERVAMERRKRIRKDIQNIAETEDAIQQNIHHLDKLAIELDDIEPGFSKSSMRKMDLTLDDVEVNILDVKSEIEILKASSNTLFQQFVNTPYIDRISRKEISICSKTGLSLSTEPNDVELIETAGQGFEILFYKIERATTQCQELLNRINTKRDELQFCLEDISSYA